MKKTSIPILAILCMAVICSTTSCLSSQKIADHASAYYGDELPKEKKLKRAGIEVVNKLPADMDRIAKGSHKDRKLLPLLVYWKIDREKICTLNTKIPAVQVTNAAHQYAPKDLLDKLKGRKLELTIEEAPRMFGFRIIDHIVVVVIYPVGWTHVYFKPDGVDLKVRYRLLDGTMVVKEGLVVADNPQRDQTLKMFQSWKKAQNQFMDQYQANLVTMTKEVLDKINAELGAEP